MCTGSASSCKDGDQETWVKSTATATVFTGSIIGQLVMGYAGDVFGRNNAMCFTLFLAGLSAVASSVFSFGSAESIYSTIIACRFFLGIGLGGVYPLRYRAG